MAVLENLVIRESDRALMLSSHGLLVARAADAISERRSDHEVSNQESRGSLGGLLSLTTWENNYAH